MDIQGQLIQDIAVFKPEMATTKVLDFFAKNTFSHLAVIEEELLLGMLSENDIDTYKEHKTIADCSFVFEHFFVKSDANWLDVLEVFSVNEANVVPVVNENMHVIGYYNLADIVHQFIATPFFTEPGDIVVVAKGTKDYSFSEIAQIVESNNAKIIGGFVTDLRADVVEVTVKISKANLNDILQTFRRYNYTILLGSKDDQFLEELKSRSEYLSKYLNV